MKVLKFGGSSVASADRIEGVISILKTYHERGDQFAVVCSALGGVTDLLISMSTKAAKADESYLEALEDFKIRHEEAVKSLITGDKLAEVEETLQINIQTLENLLQGIYLVREASKRTMDYVISFGERSSNYIIAMAMQDRGISAEYLDARTIIKTNTDFGAATVDKKHSYTLIREAISKNDSIKIVTGFIASNTDGLTTTLGRGGSDYTAALLAGAMDAQVLEIWTDVDGVLTTDPRKVEDAFTIKQLSYNEAMEMSHYGAKVIYPPTIQPALEKEIPIYIKNTFNPEFIGTKIDKHIDPIKDDRKIKGVSAMKDISLITLAGAGMIGIPGIAARLFSALAVHKINIILITQASSEHSICFAVKMDQAEQAIEILSSEFDKEIEAGKIQSPKREDDLAIVAVIGENMRNIPGIAGNLFNCLGQSGVNVRAIAQGSSELNISFMISDRDVASSLKLIHHSFFTATEEEPSLAIYLMGVGLIGKELLQQIHQQKEYLEHQLGIKIKLVGVANSKKNLFSTQGIKLEDAIEQLISQGKDSSIDSFINEMIDNPHGPTVFVDCTANKAIAKEYHRVLAKGIHIATPNKVAASSDQAYYNQLIKLTQARGLDYRYETNVGAGLPVISVLEDLKNTGDQIHKIEAVLSGTLSYIFNTFTAAKSFTQVVQQAKEQGYTEPDPREDLSGTDVARKAVILARLSGISCELDDVNIKALLSTDALQAASIDDFFKVLASEDSTYGELIQEAEAKDEKLRFIATIENGKLSAALQSVSSDNPFYGLQGSDNMIVFTTARYLDQPLVIKGPGAGASVTAAGVFADIIHIAKTYKHV